METLGLVLVAALIVFLIVVYIVSRYKKCQIGQNHVCNMDASETTRRNLRPAKCIHGGTTYRSCISVYTLGLALSIQVDLKSALSRQNIRIDVPLPLR